MSVGGVVLCGGRSSRMGQAKLSLPFGPELMLPRVVRILSEVVSPIVVVAAPRQELPELPRGVLVARDEQEHLGPLAGLAVGLEALSDRCEAAYVSSCDVPLLRAEFVRRMIELLDEDDIAIPGDGQYHHPLAAVYRTRLAKDARELLDAGRMRPVGLLERGRVQDVDVESMRGVDPKLDSLRNVNGPEEYESALHDAGFL